MHSKALLRTSFLCAVFSLCPSLYGQANGNLSGTVSDNTGSVISGAVVKITSQGTGATRDVKTDGSGHYTATFLPVAIYTVRVESQGFQTTEQRDIRLQVDEQREVDFTLKPASVSATVEVSANEVAVETTNPTLGQVITSEQVADLPLNGRDFVSLATLTPGVTQETNPNSFFNGGPSSEVSARGSYSLSVGGSRTSSTDWLLDGNDNNELTAGGIAILPSIDAIQEFKVLTYNYSAEYGTRAGPTVLVTTKSGSNQFHGTLFEFFRNTALDSKSYFASSKEQFNLNQFGGALGGAIQKDKTFFFLDYQAKRQRHGTPYVGLVPTAAMKNGDFTSDPYGDPRGPSNPNGYANLNNPYSNGQPGNPSDKAFQCDASGNAIPLNSDGTQNTGASDCSVIPSSLFNSIGQQLVDLYPTANANNPASAYNYASVPVRALNEGEFDVRLDHNFSSHDSIFARFSYDQANSYVPGGTPGFAEQNAFASNHNISNHGRNVALSETHIFSSRNINQANIGFNRIFNHIISYGDGTCEAAKLGIPNANLASICPDAPPGLSQSTASGCMSCGLSSFQLSNYFAVGDRGYTPFQGGTNVYSASDSFDMVRGSHDIRVGLGIRFNQMNITTNAFQDGYFLLFGSYTGDAMAELAMGLYGGAIHDQTFKGATTGRRWKLFRPYVQDDWRVSSNLTLNVGVAWALVTPIVEAHNRQANLDFATGQYFIPGQNSDGRVGIQMDKTAIEPRFGLAWKPRGSQTTAIRAGYSIFHDSSWDQGSYGLWESPPFFAESDNFPGSCPYGSASTVCSISGGFPLFSSPPPLSSFTGTVQSQNLNFKQGMVQQFNFNVEHQLPANVVLTAGYAGSRGSHILFDGLNLNVTSPTACGVATGYNLGCGGPTTPLYPFGYISNTTDGGRTHYNSLQLKAETKSARHGLYALLGYTYSRTYDSGLSDNVGTDVSATYWPLPGASKSDWALSQINLNHQFTASVIYDLPFGKGKAFGGNWSTPVDAALGNWQVTLIEKLTSGFPVFVINSNNQSGVFFQDNASNWNRPDIVGDPNKAGPVAANPGCTAPTTLHTAGTGYWFNPCAFEAALPGELGTANRAPVNGPDYVNTDFSIIKTFRVTERVGLDFRTEIFNLFNHAQFGTPNSDIATGYVNGQLQPNLSSFGVVNSTVGNPRLFQFALKLKF